MDPCSKNNRLPDSNFFRNTGEISNNKHVYIIACEWFTQHSLPHLVFILECACFIHVFTQVCVRVRVTVREIHCVIVISSCELKCQSTVLWAITVVWGLDGGGGILVLDLVRAEIEVATELWGILIFISFFLTACLVISYVETISLPTYFTLFCFSDWINEWPHSFIISRIWFHKINNIKPICLIFSSILNSKKVPLAETLGAIVIFQK